MSRLALVNLQSLHQMLRAELVTLFYVMSMLMIVFTGIAGLWSVVPEPPVITLGKLSDFPASFQSGKLAPTPYFVDTGDYQIFVINTGTELIILDAHATTQNTFEGVRGLVKWVPNNQRFEDPLSASKYALDGRWLHGPADRDLDRFAYEVIDSEIRIYPWQVIEGAPSRWPPYMNPHGLHTRSLCTQQGIHRGCSYSYP